MTLKDTFEMTMVSFLIEPKQDATLLDHFEKLTDEYAIEFANWLKKEDTPENAEKYFGYTDKNMLEEFKKEKGL